jgi:hypothetical protein
MKVLIKAGKASSQLVKNVARFEAHDADCSACGIGPWRVVLNDGCGEPGCPTCGTGDGTFSVIAYDEGGYMRAAIVEIGFEELIALHNAIQGVLNDILEDEDEDEEREEEPENPEAN